MTMELLRVLLGWCTVINFGILIIWLLFFLLGRKFIAKWHGSFFSIPEEQINAIHYKGIAYYKIGIILFNFVPYLALVIISCKHVG